MSSSPQHEEGREPPRMRWWGWGEESHGGALDERTLGLLRETIGCAREPRPPVALSAVSIPPARLPEGASAALREIAGAEGVREDHAERVMHAAGKGYPDLVRLRAGTPEHAPDAVVLPSRHEQLRAMLELCAARNLAVVPFGGGTSVVGGVEPLREQSAGVISLDTRRLREVTVDRMSRIATVGAGVRGPELERRLASDGLTLGHWPQSFQYVSIGGCVATRSSGQASSGYGGIAKMVLGLQLAAPAGEVALQAMPASAAGPGLRELIVGSEGTLGVIDQIALRLRAAPAERVYEGAMFDSFPAGCGALRAMAQEHALPEIARLSDPAETRLSMTMAHTGGLKGRLGHAYLHARGYGESHEQRCIAILGFEGAAGEVRSRRRRAHALVRANGGLLLGGSPGRAWLAGRFEAPYLRDDLLSWGVMVETIETATRWSNLQPLHAAVAGAIERALSEQKTPGIVMCHVSHLYETGASLYFTLIARQREGEEVRQWQAVKRAACDAIVEGGGTITHHHAVGRDHAPWLDRELGREGLAAIGALKEQLDPAGIMNPGKLLLSPSG